MREPSVLGTGAGDGWIRDGRRWALGEPWWRRALTGGPIPWHLPAGRAERAGREVQARCGWRSACLLETRIAPRSNPVQAPVQAIGSEWGHPAGVDQGVRAVPIVGPALSDRLECHLVVEGDGRRVVGPHFEEAGLDPADGVRAQALQAAEDEGAGHPPPPLAGSDGQAEQLGLSAPLAEAGVAHR